MAAVEFQATPNPNAGKFVLDRKLMPPGTSRSYYSPEEAADDDLARALMDLDGVRSLFMIDDFVTVSKSLDARWEELVPRVTQVLEKRP